MDNLKQYGQNKKQIDALVNTRRMLSEDIRTEFGLSKCNNENRYCNEVIVRYYIKKQR